MPPIAQIHEPEPAAARSFALFALGFRPFYLLAGIFAVFSVLLWAAQYVGWLPGLGMLWHAHEMLFGYALAVIAGFLLTAVRTWTNLPTPTGAPLALLAALWLAGRVFGALSMPFAAAAADTAFVLGLAFGIGVPLIRSGNRRNYFFIALVLGLGTAGLAFYVWPQAALAVGLDVVMFVMAVVAGRVVPMFTNNGVPGAGAQRVAWLERTALGALLALLALDVLNLPRAAAIVCFAAAALHAVRLALWNPQRTLGTPLVWILHVSYAWIVAHLLLRGLAWFDLLPMPVATHALAVGAVGGLTLGMMTRTSLGHTARRLVAGRAETTCFLLLQAAAVSRVLLPLAWPAGYLYGTMLSSMFWSAAFVVFVAAYLPILTRPRLDGRPG
jgi:uncharacterized protein involved in response to NO